MLDVQKVVENPVENTLSQCKRKYFPRTHLLWEKCAKWLFFSNFLGCRSF
jgi:hypothetical protein